MVNAVAQKFIDTVAKSANGRVRIPLADLWRSFGIIYGVGVTGDRRVEMERLLRALSEDEKCTLPSSKASWDKSGRPHLPQFITLKNERKIAIENPASFYPWSRELAFLANQKNTIGIDAWMIVDKWLKKSRKGTSAIALRERSWEIFRNEKALDDFLKRTPFVDGTLDGFDLLKCYDTPEPFLPNYCDNATGSPILVVENTATFHSVSQWNKENENWSAIFYGRGNSFSTSWEKLPELCRKLGTKTVEYAGDIDQAGFTIPTSMINAFEHAGLSLVPCEWLYIGVLDAGKDGCETRPWTLGNAHQWLSPETASRVEKLARSGRRIPQEAFGIRELLECLPTQAPFRAQMIAG